MEAVEPQSQCPQSEIEPSFLLELLSWLGAAGIESWLDGGWGVDALLCAQTRPHKDVDLIVRVTDIPGLLSSLYAKGFAVREGQLPHSFVLADPEGHQIDIHAVSFDPDGNGVYRMQNGQEWIYPAAGFQGLGAVNGYLVLCLAAEAQVLCHAHGYIPTEKDLRDMALLAERFSVELPPQLRFEHG